MTTTEYTVLLEKDDNDTILAEVPDIPGVVSFGEDEADAIDHLREALVVMFSAMMDDNEEIPAPGKTSRGKPTVTVPTLVASKVMLYTAMRDQGVTRSELARRLGGKNPTHITRLLNVLHQSRHDQIDGALAVLGKRLVVEMKPLMSVEVSRSLRIADTTQKYVVKRARKVVHLGKTKAPRAGKVAASKAPSAKN